MFNQAILHLRVGTSPQAKDPFVYFTGYCESNKSKNADGSAKTLRIRCFAFQKGLGKTLMNYLKVGDHIVVSGTLENSDYEDKNGTKIYSVQLLINTFEFLPRNKKEIAEESIKKDSEMTMEKAASVDDVDIKDDDLPF